MKKRLLSMLLCLCMMAALLPATALAVEYADDNYGTIVRVAGTEIWKEGSGNSNITYWICNNNTLTSTNAGDDWNVKYDPTGTIPTLTLDGFKYTGEKNGVRSSVALKIVLQGTNALENTKSASDDDARYNENHCIFVKDDLTITGTDGATLTVESQNGNGIMACHPAQSGVDRHTESIAIESANITATAGGDVGIVASQSLTIKNSTINSTGKNHGLQGGNFDGGSANNTTITNSTIIAEATAYNGTAFQSAPTISGTYQWRSSSDDDWTASSAPLDFTQKYLELKVYTSDAHASHPICGASCSHSSAHSEVTWTGVSDLTSITSAGNYYLMNDVMLTAAWKPADDVVLCLNGHTITQTNDYETPVIEVEYPKTFTLTDCSDTSGKITHQDGRSGMGVESSNEFIMYGGEISGNPNGGVGAVGRFTLDGGAIRNNTVFGVMITSNEDDNVPGIFTMKSGSIEGNTSYMGGGVYAYATTKSEDVTFTMEGGTICHNTAVMGGGVYVHGATFNMEGGTICENNVTTSDDIGEDVDGGGVYISDYVEDSLQIRPVFNVSGGEITGNVKDGMISGSTLSDGTSNNAYLTAARTIKVSGSLTGTGKIGVTTEVPPADDYAVPITGTNSGDFSSYFASDNAAYESYNDNNVVKLRVKTATKVNAQTPTITAEPADATYTRGETAAPLTVSASVTDGGTLSYQWRKGDGITSSEIAGATSNTYTPPTDTVGKVEYSCDVTNTIQDNGDGGTKTATKWCSAWITVNEVDDDSGQKQTDIETDDGAPATTAEFPTAVHDEVMTDSEKAALQNGKDVKIYLEVSGLPTVPNEDRTKIEGHSALQGKTGILYLDISMYLQVMDDTSNPRKIDDSVNPVSITITIPEDIRTAPVGFVRSFQIAASHTGETQAEVITATHNPTTHTLTFPASKFSTYAIVYTDTAAQSGETVPDPDPGPNGVPPIIIEPTNDWGVIAYVGETASMGITAFGANTYQWYVDRGDGLGFVPIPGATGPSYTTSPVSMDNDGYVYRCVAMNAYGQATGPNVTLEVMEYLEIPKTGDNSRIGLYIGLMMIGLAGIGFSAFMMYRRKREN